jgi:SRSO17 transposase
VWNPHIVSVRFSLAPAFVKSLHSIAKVLWASPASTHNLTSTLALRHNENTQQHRAFHDISSITLQFLAVNLLPSGAMGHPH